MSEAKIIAGLIISTPILIIFVLVAIKICKIHKEKLSFINILRLCVWVWFWKTLYFAFLCAILL